MSTGLITLTAALALLGGGILIGSLVGRQNSSGEAGKSSNGDTASKPAAQDDWSCTNGPCDSKELVNVKVADACMKSVRANVKPDPEKASFGPVTVDPGIESHASILRDFHPEKGDKQYFVKGTVDPSTDGHWIKWVCDAYYGPNDRIDAFAYPE